MKIISQKFVKQLKHHKKLYYCLEKIYYIVNLKKFYEMIYKSKVNRDYWSKRFFKVKEIFTAIESYRDSHRIELIKIIKKYNPKSILEVGCGVGPNLRLIKEELPKTKIFGYEINRQLVEDANMFFDEEVVKEVDILEYVPNHNEEYDVILIDAVLIYITPDKIYNVIDRLADINKKVILIIEWHDFNNKDNESGNRYKGLWIRNYEKLLSRRYNKIIIKKIDREVWNEDNWCTVGAIIEGIK